MCSYLRTPTSACSKQQCPEGLVRRKVDTSAPPPPVPPNITTSQFPSPAIPPNVLRLFSWNINGIAPFLQKPITTYFTQRKEPPIPPASIRGFLQRHGWPAMLFLQEVKIATSDQKTQDQVRKAVNSRLTHEKRDNMSTGPDYDVHFTLPTDSYNARGLRGSGKVYGVASIIRADLPSIFSGCNVQVQTVEWDKEGRVGIVQFSFGSTKLAIFNIYAVNGTTNPYRDPLTGAVRGTRHDRKLEFHRLLAEECIRLESQGYDVVLAGDFNVAPDERDGYPRLRTFPYQHVLNRNDFWKKMLGGISEEGKGKAEGVANDTSFKGIDIWRATHGEERHYTYFPRTREWGTSCDRVDYVIINQSIQRRGTVKGCGMLDTQAERGPSDHVPIWVDIEILT